MPPREVEFIIMALILAALAGYTGMTLFQAFSKRISGSMQLINLLIVFSSWLLSLFLTLHEVPCRSAFWIELGELGECQVLGGASWTLGTMEPLHFMAFGQLLALQQTLLSALPGDGCRPSQRGLRWNLPAAWLPSLQLHLLAALLGVLQWRQHEQLLLDTAIAKLLDPERSPPGPGGPGGGSGPFHTPVEEAVTSAENERHRMSDFMQVIGEDHSVSALTQNYLRVLALCIHQLQTSSVTDETLEQDQEQLRDQNIGGWVGSLGRSLEADQALSCLEKSQSREDGQDFGFKSIAARSDSVQSVEEKEEIIASPAIDPSIAGRIKVGKWNFDAISAVQEYPYILRIVGTELLQNFSFVSRRSLASFLCRLEAKYNSDVPYHSNAHAADCANSLEVMLSNSGQDVHPLRTASCYLAALGHDVGHPGVNNAFMINSRHELAITYNDRSVLESFHAAELERLLGTACVLKLPKALEHKERQVRIAYILSTDMSKHMQDLADFRLKLGCKDFDPVDNVADHQLATMWLFRASDIAHSAKPWNIHRKWSMRVVQEFHAQGDRERATDLPISPLCDREHFELAKSQTGFLQFVCIPMWQELVRLENMVQAGGVQVMPRKSMSLNPTAGDRRSRMAGPAEPLNLMPELRESQTMSLGESPDPSCRVLNHSASFSVGVALRLLVQCQVGHGRLRSCHVVSMCFSSCCLANILRYIVTNACVHPSIHT
ncbi:unnamed protein product [Cladocopium goreaui]|uniref:Phosphodiesterase n=1 Tax=Cladocopium goreaui TaxID=2562237 RepID=A0A9P1FXR2_9DINO|nr:unnamed protein product [Cladocopium goreaui]